MSLACSDDTHKTKTININNKKKNKFAATASAAYNVERQKQVQNEQPVMLLQHCRERDIANSSSTPIKNYDNLFCNSQLSFCQCQKPATGEWQTTGQRHNSRKQQHKRQFIARHSEQYAASSCCLANLKSQSPAEASVCCRQLPAARTSNALTTISVCQLFTPHYPSNSYRTCDYNAVSQVVSAATVAAHTKQSRQQRPSHDLSCINSQNSTNNKAPLLSIPAIAAPVNTSSSINITVTPTDKYNQRDNSKHCKCSKYAKVIVQKQFYASGSSPHNSSKLWRPIRSFLCNANTLQHRKQQQNYFTLWQLLFLLITLATFGSTSSALLLLEQDHIAAEGTRRSNIFNNSTVPEHDMAATTAHADNIAVSGTGAGIGYLDKLDNLERSVAAVLIKVAYGTTSTTKRSIPDNSYVPSLTTIATPLLTTLRYLDNLPHQKQINMHHRNYELDLERDHALPTSAPNADILKSNSNPTYPNPNRHHSHERDRHRHLLNSTPLPTLPNMLKKNGAQSPTIPMYPPLVAAGDMPSYSPPARSFFTPPLPPEYQNPFHDKPILRGTNNEDVVPNTGTYINRRPIPPPSLMPGHERIPFRPPDIAASTGGVNTIHGAGVGKTDYTSTGDSVENGLNNAFLLAAAAAGNAATIDIQRKKALNTPSHGGVKNSPQSGEHSPYKGTQMQQRVVITTTQNQQQQPTHNTRKEVLPSIRRILSGSNGKGEIPDVLLKQVTSPPLGSYHQPPASPVVLIDGDQSEANNGGADSAGNINQIKSPGEVAGEKGATIELQTKATKMSTQATDSSVLGAAATGNSISSTPAAGAAVGGELSKSITTTSSSSATTANANAANNHSNASNTATTTSQSTASGVTTTIHAATAAAAAAAQTTWTVAWYIHVYLSVILFTVLAVYSLYKMLTYNKLTHLFCQSYFMSIHLVLIFICGARIFYLCYDAYNIHASFHIFISEILLNLPATFMTVSFSILILFLFRKSLNHKNNRYSALIRPLTVIVACGVHILLCITLHYVESYTLQQQQQLYLQQYQQQQQLLFRKQQQQHQWHNGDAAANMHVLTHGAPTTPTPPPRVLSLICQLIYIFICLSLGLLYLYLYRILKRVLRSKSQNYIHGYQNLSYAIHITIATALLFVLLAALQIFGAISISTTRPLIMRLTAEIDWLQWSYQFSLRLIEIAIITLISWVAGLKTSSSGSSSGIVGAGNMGGIAGGGGAANNGHIMGVGNGLTDSARCASSTIGCAREKLNYQHQHGNSSSHMAGFFLPCTSSSSQEQFDTDYPAVCQANTNLHTYTIRTGKLIYDDSFALNSLSSGSATRHVEYQQQPTYQRPYDTGSLQSGTTANYQLNAVEYATAQSSSGGGDYQRGMHPYADYLTDATTDHYENPNFDLRGSASVSGSGSGESGTGVLAHTTVQKSNKTSTTSTSASSSGGGSVAGRSQPHQMLLVQSAKIADTAAGIANGDGFYAEPLQATAAAATSASYDFNHFERPKFTHTATSLESWPDVVAGQPLMPALSSCSSRAKKTLHNAVERTAAGEQPERRSANSNHLCASSSGKRRCDNYNSFERGGAVHLAGVRKSGTLNNIYAGAAVGSGGPKILKERYHQQQTQQQFQQPQQRSARSLQRILPESSSGVYARSSLERASSNRHYQQQPPYEQHQRTVASNCSSDDEDDVDDDKSMLAATSHQHQPYQQQQHPAEIIN